LHLLDAGSIAAVNHGDEGVPAARPGLQLPGHWLVPAHTEAQISQLSYYLRTFPPHSSRNIHFMSLSLYVSIVSAILIELSLFDAPFL
jgi:hypothetical protein